MEYLYNISIMPSLLKVLQRKYFSVKKKEFINRQVHFYVKGKCTNELKYKIKENDAVQN